MSPSDVCRFACPNSKIEEVSRCSSQVPLKKADKSNRCTRVSGCSVSNQRPTEKAGITARCYFAQCCLVTWNLIILSCFVLRKEVCPGRSLLLIKLLPKPGWPMKNTSLRAHRRRMLKLKFSSRQLGLRLALARPLCVRSFVLSAVPFAKRFALSALSLRAARLPVITPRLAARLSGNWVSSLLYRRCLTSIVDEFFGVSAGLELPGAPKVVPLKRACAQELCHLSALVPMKSANVGAAYASCVYASGASNEGGAVVSLPCEPSVVRSLWHASDKKKTYTRLESSARAVLKKLVHEIELPDDSFEEIAVNAEGGPFKAPLVKFDFVEICGGAGVISKHASNLGLVTAPCLDISESAHYDLRGLRFLEWAICMIEDGLFASFLIEPPCTSFSAAAYPSVRSYTQPLGFDRKEEKTAWQHVGFQNFCPLEGWSAV